MRRALDNRPANGTHFGQTKAPAGGGSPALLILMSAIFTNAKTTRVNLAVRSASPARGTAKASSKIAPMPIAVANTGVFVLEFTLARTLGKAPWSAKP